jgi:predicted site-specific integrase-resolvase
MCYNQGMAKIPVQQFADRVGKHPQTVRDWIKLGWIEAEKFGKMWIIKESEIEKVKDIRQGKRHITKP